MCVNLAISSATASPCDDVETTNWKRWFKFKYDDDLHRSAVLCLESCRLGLSDGKIPVFHPVVWHHPKKPLPDEDGMN
jgi:hypothetical protein